MRETEKNLVMILAFLSGLYLIGLNMAFCHLQNNFFWWQCLIWYLAKPYDQDVSWQFFDISLVCLIAYSNIFVFHWSNSYFSKKKIKKIEKSNKLPLDDTGHSLFIVLKDHKSVEVITLTRRSNENVVCQVALEQGYDTENVAETEGTNFSSKPAQLVIRKCIDWK